MSFSLFSSWNESNYTWLYLILIFLPSVKKTNETVARSDLLLRVLVLMDTELGNRLIQGKIKGWRGQKIINLCYTKEMETMLFEEWHLVVWLLGFGYSKNFQGIRQLGNQGRRGCQRICCRRGLLKQQIHRFTVAWSLWPCRPRNKILSCKSALAMPFTEWQLVSFQLEVGWNVVSKGKYKLCLIGFSSTFQERIFKNLTNKGWLKVL